MAAATAGHQQVVALFVLEPRLLNASGPIRRDHPLLPPDEAARALVRERMAWIDRNAFRPMVGVYDGTEPDRIARARSPAGLPSAGEPGSATSSWADSPPTDAGALAEALPPLIPL